MSQALTGATDVLVIGPSGLGDHYAFSADERGGVRWRAAVHANQHGRMGAIFERAHRMATELAAAKTARPEDVQ